MKRLMSVIDELRAEIASMRQQLAQAQIDRLQAQRELEELRQFIADHREFGDDFQQYQAVKALAEREAKQREVQAARDRREAEQSLRENRRRAAMIERARQDAEANRMARYRRSGFTPLGLDVYAGRMAFHYPSKTTHDYDYEYSPFVGRFLEDIDPITTIDYSQMTISGSIMNGSDQTRHIGVAITFFDNNGNQVGHEIIQVNNARPDVPYPFTSNVQMALNRPFDSSSTYVLYADPAEGEDAMPPPAAAPPAPAAPPPMYRQP